MTPQKHPRLYQATEGGRTFNLEIVRKGSTKLRASVMPEHVDPDNRAAGIDVPIPLAQVPLWMRREAKAHLLLDSAIVGRVGYHKRRPERLCLMSRTGEPSNWFARDTTRAEAAEIIFSIRAAK